MSDTANHKQHHDEPVQDSAQLAQVIEQLRQAPIIAVDTEFIRESTFYPKVELLQVATQDESWIIDVPAICADSQAEKNLQALRDLMENPDVLKVMHAAHGDEECLYTLLNVTAKPVFDTAVGASLCGLGDGIGLGNLLKTLLKIRVNKGHARTNWSMRPLPKQLITYALQDVDHLVDVANILLEQLDGMNRRAWALRLSGELSEHALFESDPDRIAHRLAQSGKVDEVGYSVLKNLVAWRENRIRELNVPRKWLADDSVLLDLARVKPKDQKHLTTFRGLNKGEIRKHTDVILEAIKTGIQDGGIPLPKGRRGFQPTSREARVVELLRCFVGILAQEHKIALRHLVSADQLSTLVRETSKLKDSQDLTEIGILSKEANDLVGREIFGFLKGQVGLQIIDNRVQTVELP